MKTVEQLVTLAQFGDNEAYATLYDTLLPEKNQFLYNAHFASGLPQETLEEVFHDALMASVKAYEPGRPFIGLLRVALSNKTSTAGRKVGVVNRVSREYALLVTVINRTAQFAEAHEVHVSDFISRLPQELRIACELIMSGLPVITVAKRIGIAENTLRYRLRKAFRQYLS